MPKPNSNETRDEFVKRCIPVKIQDGGAADGAQAFAICSSIYDAHMSENIRELKVDDYSGVESIALVEEPAIEVDFMCFAKDKMNITMAIADKERRVICGPALIPDKMIYRYDRQTNEEFYIFFSAETVYGISQKFMIEKRTDSVNLEHLTPIEDVSMVESWIVEDPSMDKSKAMGFSVPKGTWMVSMKVNNDDVWNDMVKTGSVRGFSIEGAFVETFKSASKPVVTEYASENDDLILEIVTEILFEADRVELADWERGLSRPFAFDPNSTENEGRFRLYPPSLLDNYSRRQGSDNGISFIVADDSEGKQVIQAIRFDRAAFDESSAKAWWEANKGDYAFYAPR